MNDGFFEFGADDSSAGFRLERVELYNWGTFHNRVVSIQLDGQNGLLTGDIGSGKSTIVDAITTLLVPSHKVAYNKAAGADFKERSLRSYVMGYYKSERSEGGFAARPVPLREAGTTHSVILGVFHNEVLSQKVSLAQVFRQKEPTGQPSRFFVVADCPLSISEDLSDFGRDLSSLKKRLKAEESVEVYNRFPEYGAAFRRRFGLKNEQALELFHQTVSLKTVGNLTTFVQDHMLEAFDSQTPIDNLIHHFEDLNRAHESILKARAQIGSLTPLVKNLDSYRKTDLEVEGKVEIRNDLKYYFSHRKGVFLEERISNEEKRLSGLQHLLRTHEQKIRDHRIERDSINLAISDNGGARLDSLKQETDRLEAEKQRRLKRATNYNDLAQGLGLPLLEGVREFAGTRHLIEDRIEALSSARNELENTRSEQEYAFRGHKDSHDSLVEEIRSLKSRKSNIERRQIEIRRRLCDDLALDERTLPFIGELISVEPEKRSWEGAIERVLRSFSLSLLVPDHLYTQVIEWVDATHLNGRLVYYRMQEQERKPPQTIYAGSLMTKLRFKEESTCAAWVRDQVNTRFGDYICCEDAEEFRRVSKGLTRSGQVKGSRIRHEKDDRFAIDDRRRYVLGWINTAKIAELQKRKLQLEGVLQELAGSIALNQQKRKGFEEQSVGLEKLKGYEDFDELDWQPLAVRIEEIREEIHMLESRSDILKTLQEKLALTEKKIKDSEQEQSELRKQEGGLENKLQDLKGRLADETELLSGCENPLEEILARVEPLLKEYIGDKRLYYETCTSAEHVFREKLQNEIDAAKKRLSSLRDSIIGSMGDFNREYPTETREMDASLESGDEYRAFLDDLIGENLPKFEEKFKILLNENTIREIASFRALLNTEYQKIRERVDQINKSLHEIDYNKDRYIRLEAMNTNDVEIRGFRQDLKSCVEGSLGGAADQQYSEAKFLQVKALINRFKGREGYSDIDRKWKGKVIDVRNWFAFAASERWREDDTEYEHYTDSGGKSGGQKEKLAYTVLAASLAYQFGLSWGEVRSRSFRFVVIDEAFGRGSDESARYGLDLFRRLNLQLLIVTPLQKIHIIEPYVSSVGFVHNPEGRQSLLRCLTIDEYQEEKERYRT